jgi:carbonic anhydrase
MRISRAASPTMVFLLALAASAAIWWPGASPAIHAAPPASIAWDSAEGPAWNWDDRTSDWPKHWGDRNKYPDFCAVGQQSPIDLSGDPTPSGDIEFHYQPFEASATNNGYKIEVRVPLGQNGGKITIKGDDYVFKEFHVHSKSEHRFGVNGTEFEVHLVHEGRKGLAAVGVLMKGVEKDGNALVKLVMDGAPQRWPASGPKIKVNPNDLLPAINGHGLYYTYGGSLTTPACVSVLWVVAKAEGTVNNTDVLKLQNIIKYFQDNPKKYEFNNRPPQEKHGEVAVLQSLAK